MLLLLSLHRLQHRKLSLRRMTQQLLLLLQQSDSVRAEFFLFLNLNF